MTNNDIITQVEQITWWHSIELPLPDGQKIMTPGEVNHCTEEVATSRFGIPEDLTGKTVLDIGCWDGYFSFLAEKRGAAVHSIDPYQGFTNAEIGQRGYRLAHTLLNSKCKFGVSDLETYASDAQNPLVDIVFYFGILYHIDHPLKELEYLYKITNEFALIETAISTAVPVVPNMWQFLPGNRNDSTNKWYPSLSGLSTALTYVGFSSVEIIYAHPKDDRVTVRAIK
jgi:tRNA (mo5U34)-methyltransferase